MPVVIETKAIRPKKLKVEQILALLGDFVQTEGEIEQKEYQKTTRTWRDKPDHELDFSRTKQEIKALNLTDNRIYYFLHEGTRVRYAVLSRDWKSKTTPRRLSSGQGRGRVVLISKKFPQPGIKAREWTDVIIRKRKRPYKRAGDAVMKTLANTANRRGQE
jgi:hypothetical protein